MSILGYIVSWLTFIIILLFSIPSVASRVLASDKHNYSKSMRVAIIATMLTGHVTKSLAYCKVHGINAYHQQQVEANEASQNFDQQAIKLAKTESDTTMRFNIAWLSFCHSICSFQWNHSISRAAENRDICVTDSVSVIVIFLSFSLNRGLKWNESWYIDSIISINNLFLLDLRRTVFWDSTNLESSEFGTSSFLLPG